MLTLASLVVALLTAAGCAKSSAAKVGEECTSEDGCEGTTSCIAGTCFQLCASDSDCSSSGRCSTFASQELKEKFKACERVDGGAPGSSSSTSGGSFGGVVGSDSDTCYDALLCSGHTIKSCATQDRSCYYLVDGNRVDCASGCSCQVAAQAIVSSICK